MALIDSLRTYVNTAMALRHSSVRGQQVDQMMASGQFFLAGDGTLCVRACSVAAGNLEQSTLPTRLTADAYALVPVLRELIDRGVLTGSGLTLHDDPTKGVTLEEEGT